MADKKEYLWRPNDNSPKTNLKYDLEASHWLSAIKNSTPSPTPTFSQVSGVIGLILSFTFNFIHFIVLNIIDLVKWVVEVWPKRKNVENEIPTFDNRPKLSDEEVMEMIRDTEKNGKVSSNLDF